MNWYTSKACAQSLELNNPARIAAQKVCQMLLEAIGADNYRAWIAPRVEDFPFGNRHTLTWQQVEELAYRKLKTVMPETIEDECQCNGAGPTCPACRRNWNLMLDE